MDGEPGGICFDAYEAAHLPPGFPPAIYLTGMGEGGCVTLLVSGVHFTKLLILPP